MDREFRDLAQMVAPSVVVVEDTVTGSYCAGCVIHKVQSDAFVLTQETMAGKPNLKIHFSDGSTSPVGYFLASQNGLAVIATGEPHGSCKAVKFRDPVNDSDVFTFVLKSTSSFEHIKVFVSNASCSSASGDEPADSEVQGTENFFIASCFHQDTERMISAPVFNKSGNAIGLIVSDCCNSLGGGSTHKIRLRGSAVENSLRSMMNEVNWKHELSIFSERARSSKEKQERRNRKRARQQIEARRTASKHTKARSA